MSGIFLTVKVGLLDSLSFFFVLYLIDLIFDYEYDYYLYNHHRIKEQVLNTSTDCQIIGLLARR